jgi:LemA protein
MPLAETHLAEMPLMSATQWAVLAFAALMVFWMVGAYNRLVALRNDIGRAWQQIDKALKHRAAVLPPLVAALRAPLAGEHGALDALHVAQTETARAAGALAAKPVAVATAAIWVQAEAALASRASRVLALLDQHADVSASPAVAALLTAWREADTELGFARRLFDTAARSYNQAAQQWPTRWLVRAYGFGPAGLVNG